MGMRKVSLGVTIAMAITGLFLTMLTAGVLTSTQSVQSSGTISAVNVGVYSDPSCTINCTSLDWGTLSPGGTVTKSIYVKNTGSVSVTLSFSTSNFVPSNAQNHLTATWNRGNYVLQAGGSIMATLTLTASLNSGSISAFSFNIVITGTQ